MIIHKLGWMYLTLSIIQHLLFCPERKKKCASMSARVQTTWCFASKKQVKLNSNKKWEYHMKRLKNVQKWTGLCGQQGRETFVSTAVPVIVFLLYLYIWNAVTKIYQSIFQHKNASQFKWRTSPHCHDQHWHRQHSRSPPPQSPGCRNSSCSGSSRSPPGNNKIITCKQGFGGIKFHL